VPWWRAAYEAAYGAWSRDGLVGVGPTEAGAATPLRESVPVNVTVPAVGPDRAASIVRDSRGCRTAKVKVAQPGQTDADDLARVEAVRDALGAGGLVRVDANGLWDVDTAVRMVALLDRAAGGLEYVEQPCETVEELAAVRRRVSVPVAADESIRRADDPLRVARLEAADIAVLKVAPLGGVAACLRIAEQIGLPVVVSSALETSVGLAAGLALAAALPELRYACGLATLSLLDGDVTSAPFRVVDGELGVRRPEPDLSAEVLADEDIAQRWKERLAAVRALAANPDFHDREGDPA
jgi:o-succinylbenzoate synthase